MSKTPVFISGIGRSGTSAVIKSIAEHKEVVKPERVGEAPFVGHFVSFLHEYEDVSHAREYNLKNYQLGEEQRAEGLLAQRINTCLCFRHSLSRLLNTRFNNRIMVFQLPNSRIKCCSN